ncbi:helix-turn-helix domain-containing protein [Methylotuvimicrobium sp. KM1]|uniref:helix-turn-helix domain-containing protein n=1 Tax=Methylotuvimicrobium sp. KM1 TaxID=3377707 RepID=UPI00384EBB97
MRTLDLVEAAQLLKMHPQTVLQRTRTGDIPGAKPGKCWVFIEEDLLEWLRSLYHSPQQDVGQGGSKLCSLKERIVSTGGTNSLTPTATQYANLLKLPTEERLKN